jgi:predicted nucleic acid-binding protein
VADCWAINASPVILLSKAGVIGLLPKICEQLVIPAGVVGEVATGAEGDAGRLWLAGDGASFIVKSPAIPAQLQDAELGLGEAEVLAWALVHPGFKVVLDDKQGRFWATRLNLPLIGSIGVAVLLKRRGLIPAARPVLEKIKAAGGFVSPAAIHAALIEAGEA